MGAAMTVLDAMHRAAGRLAGERGTTLIETTVATAMLLVVMAGLMGISSIATSTTENQGHLGARPGAGTPGSPDRATRRGCPVAARPKRVHPIT